MDEIMLMALRCKEIVDAYQGKKVDVDKDGIQLISDFAYALGIQFKVSLVNKEVNNDSAGE